MKEIRSKVLQTIQKIADRSSILENETSDVDQFRAFVEEREREDQKLREMVTLMQKEDQLLINLSLQYPEEWIVYISNNNRDLIRVLAHHPDNDEIQSKLTEFFDENGHPKIPLKPDESISETFGYHHRIKTKK